MEVEGCSTAVITPKNLFLQFKRHFLQLHLQGSVPGIIDWLVEPVAGILISAAMYWRRQRWNKLGAEASPVLTNWMCPWAASGPTAAGAAISSSTREHSQSLQVWSELAAGKGSTTKGVNQKHFDYRFTRLILKWNNPPWSCGTNHLPLIPARLCPAYIPWQEKLLWVHRDTTEASHRAVVGASNLQQKWRFNTLWMRLSWPSFPGLLFSLLFAHPWLHEIHRLGCAVVLQNWGPSAELC